MSYYGGRGGPPPPPPTQQQQHHAFMPGLVASAAPTTGQYGPNIGANGIPPNSQQYHHQMAAVTAAGNSASNSGSFSQWGGGAAPGGPGRQFFPQAQGYPATFGTSGAQQAAAASSSGQAGPSPPPPPPGYAGSTAAYYPQYNQYYQSAASFARPSGVQHQQMAYGGGQQQQQPDATTATAAAAATLYQQQQYVNQFGGLLGVAPSGKGVASQQQRWAQQQQHSPARQTTQQQQQPSAAGPSHAPRYSSGSAQQQQPPTAAAASAAPPTPLKVIGSSANQGTPTQTTGRPSLGVARSGSRYDQRQRTSGKGGKGKKSALQQQSAPKAASPQSSSPQSKGAPDNQTSRGVPVPQQHTGPERQTPTIPAPSAKAPSGYGLQSQARPKAVPAVTGMVRGPTAAQLPAGPPRAAGGNAAMVQSAGGIMISDTRGLSQTSPATGAKYSDLMTSVLPPLRPGEAEFILEMWTDKRARFPLRSTVLTSRWQTSPDHTYRHRMQIYPRGYQLKDLPAAQRKPTDSWLAVNVIVEHEPKPQSPFAGTTYPWMESELRKQVMVWIPNYKSPSTSIIRYGPGVFSKQQPTLGWSGLLDLQSDPAKLIEAGWIDSSGKLVIRSMVVDTEKDVVVKVAFTSSWLKTKQEVADAQAKAKAQEQMELDKEAEAARQAARQLALAVPGGTGQAMSAQANGGVVSGKGQGGNNQTSQGRKWIQPAFPNHEEIADKQQDTQEGNATATQVVEEQPRPKQGETGCEHVRDHRRQSGHRGRRGGRNRNGKQEVITVITHKPGEGKAMIGEKAKGDDETEEGEISKDEASWGTPDDKWEKKRKSTDGQEENEGEHPPPAKVRRGPSLYDARPPATTKHHEFSDKPSTPHHTSPSAAVKICDSRKKVGEGKVESWEIYCSKANDKSGKAQKGKSTWSEKEWDKKEDQSWEKGDQGWEKGDQGWEKGDQGWEKADQGWEKADQGWEKGDQDWAKGDKKDAIWEDSTWERWDSWERSDWEEPRPAVGAGEKWADAWERETKEADASPSWRSSYAAEWTKSEVPKDFWEEKAEPEPLSVIRDARRRSSGERQPTATPIRERMPSLPVSNGAKQRTRYTMKDDTTPLSSRSLPGPVWDWRQPSRSRDRSQERLQPLVRTPPPQEPRQERSVDRPVLLRPRPEAAREPSIIDDRSAAPRPLPSKPVRTSKPRAKSSGKSSNRRTSGEAPSGHMVYDRPAGHDMAYYRRQSDKW